jgi:FdhE protein
MIAKYSWKDRIERARHLASALPHAGRMLAFYAEILEWQQGFFNSLATQSPALSGAFESDHPVLLDRFGSLLDLIAERGADALAAQAGDLAAERAGWRELLAAYWNGESKPEEIFFARVCLQPYLELLARERTPPFDSRINAFATASQATLDGVQAEQYCPFCGRNPQLAFLSADVSVSSSLEGNLEGGRRFLMCGDCLTSWPFQRIACPSCLEVDPRKLAYFSPEDAPGMRVECCDTCRLYLKSIDLTKDARPIPPVDELAAIHLDLWAREQGYQKIQANLAGI